MGLVLLQQHEFDKGVCCGVGRFGKEVNCDIRSVAKCYVSRFLIKYLALTYNKIWGSLNAGSE